MAKPWSLQVDPEYSRVDVTADLLEEPETATVDADGYVRDDDGRTFDRRTYSVVDGSQQID